MSSSKTDMGSTLQKVSLSLKEKYCLCLSNPVSLVRNMKEIEVVENMKEIENMIF